LRSIKNEIDSSMDRIDFLLGRISKKKEDKPHVLANIDNLDRRGSSDKSQRDNLQKLTMVTELV
jgi:hypothetical protein